jgi:hypothetical protein
MTVKQLSEDRVREIIREAAEQQIIQIDEQLKKQNLHIFVGNKIVKYFKDDLIFTEVLKC